MYGGRPNRGTPGDALTVRLAISSNVKTPINAFALETVSAEGLQTRLLFSGPLTQSGKAAETVWYATTVKITACRSENHVIVETRWGRTSRTTFIQMSVHSRYK